MTADQIRQVVVEALTKIAPEITPASIVLAVHERLYTLDDAVAYLALRTGSQPGT